MNLKKLVLVTLTSFVMGSFFISSNTYESTKFSEVQAETPAYVVYLETVEWWTSGTPENGWIKIRQVNNATPGGYFLDMVYVANSGSNNVFRGILNADTTGFQFYVNYGLDPAQHYTTFISGTDLNTARSSGNRYYKLNSGLSGGSNQTFTTSSGHPSETITVSKLRENTLLGTETIQRYKTNFSPTLISVSGYDFFGWFGDRARLDSLTTTHFDTDRNIFGDYRPVFNEDTIRIAVVRPSWWKNDVSYQPLRIADTFSDLSNHITNNITFYRPVAFVNDPFYSLENTPGVGFFNEYETDGILFYDVFLNDILGKYVDLARYVGSNLTSNSLTSPANWTGTEFLFQNGDNNSIWRIYESEGAQYIFRPTGISAESRNISDASVAKILEGYLTCNDSTSNGYQAFKNLNENFNLLSRTSSSETLNDYDFDTFTNYGNTRGAGETTTIANKIVRMQAEYNGANPLNPINSAFNPSITNQTQTQGLHNTLLLLSLIILAYLTFKKLIILNN
jgi:hypothetical protein